MLHKYFGEIRGRWAARVTLGAIAALVSITVAAAPARAQDSLQVGERPAVHVVTEGETLWELARLYLGDPFLWPEIYRLNTTVVEDPHWIYPGEELLLAMADRTAVPLEEPVDPGEEMIEREPEPEAPEVEMPDAPPPPPPVEEAGPTVFTRTTPVAAPERVVPMLAEESYRAVRKGDFYAAGFLTEEDELPWAEVRGRAERGGGPDRIGGRTAFPFGRIVIVAPQGAAYHVGDTVFTAQVGRDVPRWGDVVVPTGLARVEHVSGREVVAELFTVFSRVTPNQVAMPIEPFRNPGESRPASVDGGLEGSIITVRDRHPLPNQQDIVFIDIGREAGVVPGDLFEVVRADVVADAPPERIAVLQVVHVRERSASAMLLQIMAPGTRDGSRVRLIGKMPS